MISFCFRLLIACLCFVRPVSAQEVDVRDMQSVEEYALALYEQGKYRQAEHLLNDVARNGDSRSMRDRARYNSALAAYQQGKLGQALSTLDSMEEPNPQSIHNAQYIKKEIEERRKNQGEPPPQQEEQDQQGQGQSSSPQEGEKGEEQQDSSQQDAQKGDEQQDNAQQDSGQSDSQQESNQEQQGDDTQQPQEGDQAGEEMSQDSSADGGIPQEALSPEEWSKREAERLLDSIEEGQHRGFGEEGESSSGTKTW